LSFHYNASAKCIVVMIREQWLLLLLFEATIIQENVIVPYDFGSRLLANTLDYAFRMAEAMADYKQILYYFMSYPKFLFTLV
jgi:hypothetical protein